MQINRKQKIHESNITKISGAFNRSVDSKKSHQPAWETLHANYQGCQTTSSHSHRKPKHSSPPLCKMQLQDSETSPGQQYPKSTNPNTNSFIHHKIVKYKTTQNPFPNVVIPNMTNNKDTAYNKTNQHSTQHKNWLRKQPTCRVTNRSSITSSLVTKSAPIVALYCWLNFLCTYLFQQLRKTKQLT